MGQKVQLKLENPGNEKHNMYEGVVAEYWQSEPGRKKFLQLLYIPVRQNS